MAQDMEGSGRKGGGYGSKMKGRANLRCLRKNFSTAKFLEGKSPSIPAKAWGGGLFIFATEIIGVYKG